MELDERLKALRAEIDAVDQQVAELLQRRARISLEVGAAKQAHDAAVFAPAREVEVLAHVQTVEGPLPAAALAAIYREVLSASRGLQRPLRIAHLGPAATFGHQAAREKFGSSSEFEPCPTNTAVIDAVERGRADFGLVPFQNSTEGPVSEVLDRLVDTPLQVCAEITIPVAHCLMSRERELSRIARVLSHPQASGQSRGWLQAHLPGVPVEPASSTGGAAEIASREPGVAAVAPRIAAEVFGLNLLAEGIQDVAENFTRFFVLGRAPSERPTGSDRTAVVFSIRDRVGALRDLTDAFASHGVNLSSIQSRPSRKRVWDYVFFVELVGHIQEERVAKALRQAQEHTVFLKVLGSWPVGGEPVDGTSVRA